MSEYRLERLGVQIQEEIGAMIVSGKVKDPRVDAFLSVTRVEVSRDLSWAEVYISSYEDEGKMRRGVEGLTSAAGYIQSQLNAKMHIRQTPRLRFHADMSIKDGFDLVKRIEGLNG